MDSPSQGSNRVAVTTLPAHSDKQENRMATVHIVKINSESDSYHIVEEECTGDTLHECDTQKEAIDWAEKNDHTYQIHRERNRKPTDEHGQFRTQ